MFRSALRRNLEWSSDNTRKSYGITDDNSDASGPQFHCYCKQHGRRSPGRTRRAELGDYPVFRKAGRNGLHAKFKQLPGTGVCTTGDCLLHVFYGKANGKD